MISILATRDSSRRIERSKAHRQGIGRTTHDQPLGSPSDRRATQEPGAQRRRAFESLGDDGWAALRADLLPWLLQVGDPLREADAAPGPG